MISSTGRLKSLIQCDFAAAIPTGRPINTASRLAISIRVRVCVIRLHKPSSPMTSINPPTAAVSPIRRVPSQASPMKRMISSHHGITLNRLSSATMKLRPVLEIARNAAP